MCQTQIFSWCFRHQPCACVLELPTPKQQTKAFVQDGSRFVIIQAYLLVSMRKFNKKLLQLSKAWQYYIVFQTLCKHVHVNIMHALRGRSQSRCHDNPRICPMNIWLLVSHCLQCEQYQFILVHKWGEVLQPFMFFISLKRIRALFYNIFGDISWTELIAIIYDKVVFIQELRKACQTS